MPTRRTFLQSLAAATLSARALAQTQPTTSPATAPSNRVLFFTKSSGFEHDGVKRTGGREGWAETMFREIAERAGFTPDVTKDGTIFDRPEFDAYAVVAFYTTGDLTRPGTDRQPPMTPAGKRRLLSRVSEGRLGFAGIHCAADTFRGDEKPTAPHDDYTRMLGGRFESHGKQQPATLVTKTPHPLHLPNAPAEIAITEEWYAFDHHAHGLHVVHEQQTTGMTGDMYARPPYPVTWTRHHNKGRVFYTSLGHRKDVWESQFFKDVLTAGLRWAGGK